MRFSETIFALTPNQQRPAHLNADFLTEAILTMMVRGVYCSRVLRTMSLLICWKKLSTLLKKIKQIKETMQSLYTRDLAKYAKSNVVALVKRSMKNNTDIPGTVREYYIVVSDNTVGEIEKMLRGGQFA